MGVNAALICDLVEADFVRAALGPYLGPGCWLLSDDPGLLAEAELDRRVGLAEARLAETPVDADRALDAMIALMRAGELPRAVLVDMSWAIAPAQGEVNLELWGPLAERLADEVGVSVLSLYDRALMIEDRMQVAFRAHEQFAAPSGLHDNPFWLPSEMQRSGTLDEQLSFLLGRVVPDYAREPAARGVSRLAARGASPEWLDRPRHVQPVGYASTRWHILCLGPLRVYTGGYKRVDWKQPGGSPRKAKTLFAYLLQSGERGAHADRLSELMWPGEADEATKRARLHYLVAMLRRTLGSKTSVLRAGEYYRLNAPAGSWIDISSFEQLCRRAVALQAAGQDAAALKVLETAERLYGGDLFEDLPQDYVDPEGDDWCLPKRVWLREMALKVQRDMSAILRRQGRLRAALEHVQRALALDPASEVATAEALRVFHAQGRPDTMARQYRQYRAALEAMGAAAEDDGVARLYRELLGTLAVEAGPGEPQGQGKTKERGLG